jgi:ADP-heptose:LPS heptosyltransferase
VSRAAAAARDAETWGPEVRDVLAVRLDAVGDVLMTTPAIRALRSCPGRSVTLLTSTAGAEVAGLVPEIDDVIVFDAPWMKASADGDDRSIERMAERLRARRFDAAAVFTVYSQNPQPAAMLCYMAGIPRRLAHSREPAYRLLTHRVDEPEPQTVVRHEVDRQLDLVACVGARTDVTSLSIRIGDRALSATDAWLVEEGIEPDRPWAVLHPGASAPSRRYPPEAFAAAATELGVVHGWHIVLAGGPGDRDVMDAVRRALPAMPLLHVRETDGIEDLGALLERAPLLIANNSAPAHIAAAVGTPVVDLYALTNPQHAPWGVPARVLYRDVPCRFCYASVCSEVHHRCLRGVPPGDVVAAALELMRKGRLSAALSSSRGRDLNP